MSGKELSDNVNTLIDQTAAGKVDNEIAMKVFQDAYKALPKGGSVEHSDEILKYENGPTLVMGTHRDPNGLWLNGSVELTGPGSEKCPTDNKFIEQKNYECLRENFGFPIGIERKTEYDDGSKNEHSYSASRSPFWKNPVADKDVRTYYKQIGDYSLKSIEDGIFQNLTISKLLPDGAKLELSFVRPDKFDATPVRYKGTIKIEPDGRISENRSLIRMIGRSNRSYR